MSSISVLERMGAPDFVDVGWRVEAGQRGEWRETWVYDDVETPQTVEWAKSGRMVSVREAPSRLASYSEREREIMSDHILALHC